MKRIGGMAAFLQGLAYLLFLMLVLGFLPASGGYILSDYTDPTQILRKAALHPSVVPMLFAIDLLDIAFGFLPLLVIVAVVERIRQATASEHRLILGLVLINTALWLAAAAIDSGGLPIFLDLYSKHPEEAIAGYRVVGIVSLQLGNAAACAYGLSLLVMSWAAWHAKAFSRAFLVLSFVWGIIAVLSWPFVIAGAIGSLVGVVWSVWLSILLWSSIQPTAVAGAVRTDTEATS